MLKKENSNCNICFLVTCFKYKVTALFKIIQNHPERGTFVRVEFASLTVFTKNLLEWRSVCWARLRCGDKTLVVHCNHVTCGRCSDAISRQRPLIYSDKTKIKCQTEIAIDSWYRLWSWCISLCVLRESLISCLVSHDGNIQSQSILCDTVISWKLREL